jgi:hypothetical protein
VGKDQGAEALESAIAYQALVVDVSQLVTNATWFNGGFASNSLNTSRHPSTLPTSPTHDPRLSGMILSLSLPRR